MFSIIYGCQHGGRITHGSHRCGLCHRVYGNGEVWIPGDDGRVYASPVMLAHYVKAHHYLPPPEFVSAVTAAAAPLTEEECGERIYARTNRSRAAGAVNVR